MKRLIVFMTALLTLIAGATFSPARADLLVSSFNTDSVLRYDQSTGAFLGAFHPAAGAWTRRGGCLRSGQ